MKLHIKELLEEQQRLDDEILRIHHLTRKETIQRRVLAFLVELSELANETRSFKFWSTKGMNTQAIILEEYVDGLHFILSMGLDLQEDEMIVEADENNLDVNELLISLYQMSIQLFDDYSYLQYRSLFALYLSLGECLKISDEDLYSAYQEKNRINHQRQVEHY